MEIQLVYAIEESCHIKNIECILAQLDTQNSHNINTLMRAGMINVNNDSEYTNFYTKKEQINWLSVSIILSTRPYSKASSLSIKLSLSVSI